MRRKKGTEEAPTTGDARITPEEVQQAEFRLAFRGYNERDAETGRAHVCKPVTL